MSLSKWFRNYLYYPLGGNRKGMLITLRNIALVWILTGFWHGASWNYVLWGIYFAVVLIMEKVMLKNILPKMGGFLSRVYTLPVLMFSFVIFALEDLNHLFLYLKVMAGNGPLLDQLSLYFMSRYGVLFILLILFSTPWPYRRFVSFTRKSEKTPKLLRGAFLFGIFLLSTAYIVDGGYNPFLYFRF